MPVVPKDQWPECLRGWDDPETFPPECFRDRPLVGVFVGGCVSRGDGSRFRAFAHAHTTGKHRGWICMMAARRLQDRLLMLHELAHILTGHGHTDVWRAKLLAIGGTLDAHDDSRAYHKKPPPAWGLGT